jgi:hypothetical protein
VTTPARNVVAEIINGDHDNDLSDIAKAVARRERALSPSDAIIMLGQVFTAIEQHANAPVQQRAQVGSELNQALKNLSSESDPTIQSLVKAARVDVLVKLMGVPRETATTAATATTAGEEVTTP